MIHMAFLPTRLAASALGHLPWSWARRTNRTLSMYPVYPQLQRICICETAVEVGGEVARYIS